MSGIPLPAGVAVSRLAVYADGGTPHLHLASAEAYVVLGGAGEVQTLDGDGFRRTPLEPGTLVSFRPGTVHRLVDGGGLDILTVMQNAGLPEAGDAVMTFPDDVLADPARYRAAATLPEGADPAGLDAAVARRRALALAGWDALLAATAEGDPTALRGLHARAQALVAERIPAWRERVAAVAAAPVAATGALLDAIAAADPAPLAAASLRTARPEEGPRRHGMCGRLQTWG